MEFPGFPVLDELGVPERRRSREMSLATRTGIPIDAIFRRAAAAVKGFVLGVRFSRNPMAYYCCWPINNYFLSVCLNWFTVPLKDRSHLKGLANEVGNAEPPHPAPALFQAYNGLGCDEECRWCHMSSPVWIQPALNGYSCDLGFQEKPTKSWA